jgi:hypothetical protein
VAKSPRNSCDDLAEVAIPLVRKLVGARRRWGLSWDQSLADVAPELGITPWRVHTLYYRLAGIRPVLLAEWNRFRVRGAAMLLAEAVRLRRLADELDAEADYLESRQCAGVARCEPAPGADVQPEAAD